MSDGDAPSAHDPKEDALGETLRRVLRQYTHAEVHEAERLRFGHINDSFRVTFAVEGSAPVFVQRINSYVFPHPERVVDNVTAVVDHLRTSPLGALVLERTLRGAPAALDDAGETWRVFNWVEHQRIGKVPETLQHIRAASAAFGTFHEALASLDASSLHETIEHFHDTPHRMRAFDHARAADRAGRCSGCTEEIAQVEHQRGLAGVVADHLGSADFPRRTVHNDAKFSNVLLDARDRVLCVVDLDTVMPGSVLYDVGHMIRSMTHTFDEDETNLDRVRIDEQRLRALLEGYFSTAAGVLTPVEVEHVMAGAQVMVLQEAVRFLTDHLDGDLYFKAHRPLHNLDRCRMHLALLRDLQQRDSELRALVHKCAR